ncbi:glutathione S-transferase T3-like protein, partial [Tanacetum coccineum]
FGYTMNITEKSDVYSYGVALLEFLSVRSADENRLREGPHIVEWVKKKMGSFEPTVTILDTKLQGLPDQMVQEKLQTHGIAMFCVNSSPAERPTMKEVVALLMEVKCSPEEWGKNFTTFNEIIIYSKIEFSFEYEKKELDKWSSGLMITPGYWQEPNSHESPIEQVATSPTKKKATRNRQKRQVQTDDAPQQTAWITKEEIALAKGWRAISENSERGRSSDVRYGGGKWKVMRPVMVRFCGIYSNVIRMAQDSEAGDEDYIQKAMVHYQAECGLLFKFRHCWDVLKDSPGFKETVFPNFNQGSQGSSKRHKSSGSSSFNAESGDASINLNNTVDDEEDVLEIRRPEGRDKAKAAAKNKGSKASGSSTMNDDALARLMVTEMTTAEVAQREKVMELKRREVECREREIAAAEYQAQQEDMRLYLRPYEYLSGEQRLVMDAIRAQIKVKYNLQF